MPTVMVTFVQATYALLTFVHISCYWSDLDKLVGPNFFGIMILGTKTFFEKTSSDPIFLSLQNFFPDKKNLLGPKNFRPKSLLDLKKIRIQIFFGPEIFFRPNIFFRPKIFWTQNFSNVFFQIKIFFGPTIFSNIFSGTKILFWP